MIFIHLCDIGRRRIDNPSRLILRYILDMSVEILDTPFLPTSEAVVHAIAEPDIARGGVVIMGRKWAADAPIPLPLFSKRKNLFDDLRDPPFWRDIFVA
jgi:hypothetical protein